MRNGPHGAGRSAAVGYVAAAVVAVAVFYGGIVLDARLHPMAQPDEASTSLAGTALAVLTALGLVLVAALVPVWVGLAAFRAARVTHPAWFAVYGVATGLLLANLFRDPSTGLALPGLAGAAGGLMLRAVMGRPAEPPSAADALSASVADQPQAARDRLADHDAQAAYLSDALASGDAALVALALREIGAARRIPVALDDNPPLGEALRAARDLGLDLVALQAAGALNASPPAGS